MLPSSKNWKAEKERKQARINAMRAEREERVKTRAQQISKKDPGAGGDAGASLSMDDVDKMLGSFNIDPVSKAMHSLNSMVPSPDSSLPHDGKDGSLRSDDSQKKKVKLVVTQVTQTNIPAQEKVAYSKETQTAQSGPDHRDSYYDMWLKPRKDEYNLNPSIGMLEWDDEFAADEEDSSLTMDHRGHKLPPGILPHGFPQAVDVQPALTAAEKEAKKEKEEKVEKPKDLSDEEKQVLIMSQPFQRFFDKSVRIMERALCEPHADIFIDYSRSADSDDASDEKSATRLSLNRVFYDEKWSKNRCVTCLDWSAQYPELLAASYSNNEDSPHEPDGVCLVWNTKFNKTTPEFIFHCQSSVTAVSFAKFHPNLVLGGTYSGSIVLWDNRLEKRTPVQRSPLTTSAHTHPVYCLKVVGTQNSHNVISISTDGKLCSWSLDMLAQPQEILDLQHKQNKAVAATCLAFPQGSVNNFVIGSEEGAVYTACRHGTKTGILDSFEGHHHAPITGIHPHNASGAVDFSHLYLTSSFDWSVKLWSLKETKPIYSFEVGGDYIYDVAWSPIHPSVFADVDGAGKLNLWNLNNDTELPSATVTVDGPAALNRVSWTQSGLHVVAADDMGKISVYDVGEQLANPRPDEWTRFSKTLTELQINQTGDDLDAITMNSR
ncbi:cytoplasmic dynein 1 intermediate chain isoform X4 [Folsomia candida]|uniref:cytoplasmic dynein 1 intermediate chain isoform X4 n=1 Tax=Folsomia candida TaxID=158441 RepID=UPI001604E196|nr:cytoplasmic dynein 1 intermediate chain isoform X4 [Folsomia candida]